MAYEAQLRYRKSHPVDFTVADGTAIEKGALLTLTDPLTVTAATNGGMCAGVAAREKVASDGRTRIAVFQDGTFDMYCSGAALVGQLVAMSLDNYVKAATAGLSGAQIIGTFKETATDGEQVLVELNIGGFS